MFNFQGLEGLLAPLLFYSFLSHSGSQRDTNTNANNIFVVSVVKLVLTDAD